MSERIQKYPDITVTIVILVHIFSFLGLSQSRSQCMRINMMLEIQTHTIGISDCAFLED